MIGRSDRSDQALNAIVFLIFQIILQFWAHNGVEL